MPAGRPPKPVEQHILEGTFREDRHGAIPPAEKGEPASPFLLTKELRKLWSYYVPLLLSRGTLTLGDGTALYMLCRAAGDYRAACRKVAPGKDVCGAARKQYWSLWAAARDKAEARLMDHLKGFGLTAASRTSIKDAGAPQTDKPDSVSGFARKRS